MLTCVLYFCLLVYYLFLLPLVHSQRTLGYPTSSTSQPWKEMESQNEKIPHRKYKQALSDHLVVFGVVMT